MDAKHLCEIIGQSNNIVFFGGAGMSTESGIADFRSENGIYKTSVGYLYPPETMLSHSFFCSHTVDFYNFYREKMIFKNAQPNPGHIALATLEQLGRLKCVVTQNIDGLHQLAGSKTVYELHGSVHRNYCTKCRKFYPLDYIADSRDIPQCFQCGGIVKPDVVLYEEVLDDMVVSGAIAAISKAEVLIVGGTSLVVYPAAGLINYFKGDKLILINKSSTPYDSKATMVFHQPVGKLLSDAVNML